MSIYSGFVYERHASRRGGVVDCERAQRVTPKQQQPEGGREPVNLGKRPVDDLAPVFLMRDLREGRLPYSWLASSYIGNVGMSLR